MNTTVEKMHNHRHVAPCSREVGLFRLNSLVWSCKSFILHLQFRPL